MIYWIIYTLAWMWLCYVMGGHFAWYTNRETSYEKRPYNWRIWIGPNIYFKWLDKNIERYRKVDWWNGEKR